MRGYKELLRNLRQVSEDAMGSLEEDEFFVLSTIMRWSPLPNELTQRCVDNPIFKNGKYGNKTAPEKEQILKSILNRLDTFQLITQEN